MDSIDIREATDRLVDRVGANEWLVLVTSHDGERIGRRVESLAESMDESVCLVCVSKLDELIEAARRSELPLIVSGLSRFDAEEWQRLDFARSRMERSTSSLVILDPAALAVATQSAPNFMSWVGASAWELVDSQTDVVDSVKSRIEQLRSKFGMTDAELLAAIDSGRAPLEPAIAEWLALIGHAQNLK